LLQTLLQLVLLVQLVLLLLIMLLLPPLPLPLQCTTHKTAITTTWSLNTIQNAASSIRPTKCSLLTDHFPPRHQPRDWLRVRLSVRFSCDAAA
jgi:hypothetical protein